MTVKGEIKVSKGPNLCNIVGLYKINVLHALSDICYGLRSLSDLGSWDRVILSALGLFCVLENIKITGNVRNGLRKRFKVNVCVRYGVKSDI